MVDLLPCPFCGGEAAENRTSVDSDTTFEIACGSCGASVEFWLPWTASDDEAEKAKSDNLERWNSRTPPQSAGLAAGTHVVVPVEPTEGMAVAGASATAGLGWTNAARSAYRAMLAAAQKEG